MTDFHKKFLAEEPKGRGNERGREIHLAGFGKHPGWDDHIEDIGLETETLVLARKVLYVEGIGGQIDKGAWDKLEPAQQGPPFDHIFVWRRAEQILIGKLWASSDGKGRTRYPMIVCAHCFGLPVAWVLNHVVPCLNDIHQLCTSTKSASEVQACFGRVQTTLDTIVGTPPESLGEGAAVAGKRRAFVDSGDLGPDQEGLFRILHQIKTQMSAYLATKSGRTSAAMKTSMDLSLRAQHIRVPQCVSNPAAAIMMWDSFLQPLLSQSASLLLFVPLSQNWIDVIVGEPTSPEFFCLKASPKAIPLASQVPYKLDSSFRQEAKDLIETFLKDEGAIERPTTARSPLASTIKGTPQVPALPKEAGSRTRKKSTVVKALLAIIGVMAAVVGLALFESNRRRAVEPGAETASPRQRVNDGVAAPQQLEAPLRTPDGVREGSTVGPGDTPDAALTEKSSKLTRANNAEASETQQQVAEGNFGLQLGAEPHQPDIAKADGAGDAMPNDQHRTSQDDQTQPREDGAEQLVPQLHQAEKLQEEQRQRTLGEMDLERESRVTNRPEEPRAPVVAPAETYHATAMTNSIGMIYAWVPGAPDSDRGLWVGVYEVTQEEYQTIMGVNPSQFKNPRQPVENVGWEDAMEFCRRLTEREHSTAAKLRYTLPTETQWEYLVGDARLENSVTSMGLPSIRRGPETVGSSGVPNRFSLYDIRGNVGEWCGSDDQLKPVRGGDYRGRIEQGLMGTLAVGHRVRLAPTTKAPHIGFRCVAIAQERTSQSDVHSASEGLAK